MLHPLYMKPGTTVQLPELAAAFGGKVMQFLVEGCYPGGMGLCLRIRPSGFDQSFALKAPRPDLLCMETAREFEDELRIWLKASCCTLVADALAVVRVNECPAVLSPWYTGGDLSRSLARLDRLTCIRTLIRVVRALDWVHKNLGVIHRDLKPLNILMDAGDRAYVSDWGLAKPVDAYLATAKAGVQINDARHKQSDAGQICGTIYYASPEQILAKEAPGIQSDMYALGCIMYEMETGHVPFPSAKTQDVVAQHLFSRPKALAGLFRQSRLGLGRIAMRCLEKDPRRRFASYMELESELRKLLRTGHALSTEDEATLRRERHVLGCSPEITPTVGQQSATQPYFLCDLHDVEPFLGQANDLMACGKYRDAIPILKQLWIPEVLPPFWSPVHCVGCNLARCYSSISDHTSALAMFSTLAQTEDKPPEYYVNHSLAALRNGDFHAALNLVREGLTRFPDDPDLLGNATIAAAAIEQFDEACHYSALRLAIRRDFHSLEEAASLHHQLAERIEWKDLPKAAEHAAKAIALAQEAAVLAPHQKHVLLTAANGFLWFKRFGDASNLYRHVAECGAHQTTTEIAILGLGETLVGSGLHEESYRFCSKWLPQLRGPSVVGEMLALKLETAVFQLWGHDSLDSDMLTSVKADIEDLLLGTKDEIRENPRCDYLRARVAALQGRHDQARELFRVLLSRFDYGGVYEYVRFALHTRQFDEALCWCRRLVEEFPWRAGAYDLASTVADACGATEDAARFKQQGDAVFADDKRIRGLA